jgi:predicted amidohydrolase YtcJ
VILENGLIRTLDPLVPTQRALAIAGDRIAGGVAAHETALASPEVVDLGGRVVLPGFSDAHVHFPSWALAQAELDLGGCGLEEALERVRAHEPPAGGWIRGRGWRGFEPTRAQLDAVTGDTPAALWAKDGHTLWVNTAALERAGAHGDGLLREEDAWRFHERHLVASEEEYLEAMRRGLALAAARGVTAVHDKDGRVGALRLWQRLEQAGTLTVRVWQSLPADRVGELRALGIRSGFGSPLLRLGYLKVFADGTLGSRTALMLDGRGMRLTTREELERIVRSAAEAGFPVAVHAIGDRANREALDAFEATRAAWAPLGLRQRIEHAQLLAADDVGRFAALGVAASVQFSHAPSDRELAERWWPGLTDGAYAYRSLLEAGALVANGSDAPVEELDPLAGVRAAVRRDWHPEQALTVREAFEATCVAPAVLAGEERRRGKLLPGYAADLVVLDRDPWDDLDARVEATMVAGRWVHNPPPWPPRILPTLDATPTDRSPAAGTTRGVNPPEGGRR